MSVKTFAAIDLGSYELTLKIFELSGKSSMREVDCVSRRLDLGSGTYVNGRITADKIDELCRVLKEFKGIMNTYKVDAYRAYATSAIREADNAVVVLGQIAQRTGMRPEVLSNSEQRFLDYKSIASKGESFRRVIEKKTAIVDIGGGSIQLSLFENDTLVSTQNLLLGVLRVQERLHHLNAGPAHFEQLVGEMAAAELADYKKFYLKDIEVQNIIIVDDYLSPWAVRSNRRVKGKETLGIPDCLELIAFLRANHPADAASKLDISEERVPLLFISAVLTCRIAELMGAKKIWTPGVTLCDGIAYEYAESLKMFRGEHDFEKDIAASAMNINKRYMGSRKQAESLRTIATEIFDSMKKIHGLGRRERLYLRLAATLYDCGKFISMMNVGEIGYNIIMATEIIGLSHKEREMVANIVRFSHSPDVYYGMAAGMERENYLTVAKLTAILRLGASMDLSRRQKLKNLKAVLKDNELYLNADTTEDISLESDSFASNVEFFQEVFSVTPVLKQHRNI